MDLTFQQLETLMRTEENARDGELPTAPYIIARLDGRGFSRLTGRLFEKPFDEAFHLLMMETMRHLMHIETELAFAYNQSDEISLLMLPGSAPFNRKARKLLSLLPAAASARLSLLLGEPVCFDCRLNLQTEPLGVHRYFRWRSIDAERNAFNACAYWLLRKQGTAPETAAEKLRLLTAAEQRKLLADNGIDFDSIPGWQRRGSCLYRTQETRCGFNPLTGEQTTYTRRKLLEEDFTDANLSSVLGMEI